MFNILLVKLNRSHIFLKILLLLYYTRLIAASKLDEYGQIQPTAYILASPVQGGTTNNNNTVSSSSDPVGSFTSSQIQPNFVYPNTALNPYNYYYNTENPPHYHHHQHQSSSSALADESFRYPYYYQTSASGPSTIGSGKKKKKSNKGSAYYRPSKSKSSSSSSKLSRRVKKRRRSSPPNYYKRKYYDENNNEDDRDGGPGEDDNDDDDDDDDNSHNDIKNNDYDISNDLFDPYYFNNEYKPKGGGRHKKGSKGHNKKHKKKKNHHHDDSGNDYDNMEDNFLGFKDSINSILDYPDVDLELGNSEDLLFGDYQDDPLQEETFVRPSIIDIHNGVNLAAAGLSGIGPGLGLGLGGALTGLLGSSFRSFGMRRVIRNGIRIFIALLLLPLLLLFVPIPIVSSNTNNNSRDTHENGGGGTKSANSQLAELSRKMLNSENCIERISCEINHFNEITGMESENYVFTRFMGIVYNFDNLFPQFLVRIAHGYLNNSEDNRCTRFHCTSLKSHLPSK